jgi:hypothetical protein
MLLGKFVKQPQEYLGYDIIYTDFLGNTDSVVEIIEITSTRYTSDPVNTNSLTNINDLVVDSSYIRDNGTRIKVYLRNGVVDEGYKVTIRVRTKEGLIKEDEFKIRIKDY